MSHNITNVPSTFIPNLSLYDLAEAFHDDNIPPMKKALDQNEAVRLKALTAMFQILTGVDPLTCDSIDFMRAIVKVDTLMLQDHVPYKETT
jgi:hypothetical protein